MAKDVEETLTVAVEAAVEADLTEVHVKCTKQPVQIAAKNVKYHLNLHKTDQYIVKIVLQNTNQREIIDFFF